MVGKTISRYRLISEVASGGMGTVYKAEDLKLQRTVALKFLGRYAAAGGSDDDHKSRFLHEARAAAALDHPNICGVYEIDEADGETFLAMPFLDGRPLDERIAEGPLKLAEAVDIAIQTADALEEAHSKGVVHRDIKPANIMILERDRGRLQVKLMDFGLARLAQATRLTQEGSRLGTAAYMSPEQTQGDAVDQRTDLWSLGVVLYEMTAGGVPFPAEYEQALVYAIVNEESEPLTAVRTGVPMELERIVAKCMAKSADERYQSATDLLVDLNALRTDLGGSKTRSGTRPPAATQSGESKAESAVAARSPDEQTAAPNRASLWIGMAASAVIAAFATWLLLSGSSASLPSSAGSQTEHKLRRVSWDGDLSAFPALSPDAKLLAYASDRAGRGDLDIWVQLVAGEQPRRITSSPQDELEPAFSPDGSQIIYSRRPGGVYTISALGGEPYLVAEGAYSPSFGPQGWGPDSEQEGERAGSGGQKLVAYLLDDQLFYSPVSMGEPVRLMAAMSGFGPPIWTPDGQALVVHAADEAGREDWFATPLSGEAPKPLHAAEAFQQAGLTLPRPQSWVWSDGGVLLGDNRGDMVHVALDVEAGETEAPRPLTFGTGVEAMPSSAASGLIAMAALERRRNVWALALDRNGLASGTPLQLTVSAGKDCFPDTTADGARLSYVSQRPERGDIWIRDRALGPDVNLTDDDANQEFPVLDAAGDRIAYLAREDGRTALFVRPFKGGLGREICADCGKPTSWSPDDRFVLYEAGAPLALWALEVESGEKHAIAASSDGAASLGRISPDGQSVVFRFESESESGIFVAPFETGGTGTSRADWKQISDAASDSNPAWASSGARLYFTSRRGGSLDLWTARLNGGSPEPIHRFPLTRYSLDEDAQRLAVSQDRLIFSMTSLGGSIWLLEPTGDANR